MEIIAKSKFIRTSPRKLRLVVRALKGLSPAKAQIILAQVNKGAALPVSKTLKSALANATNNHGFKEEKLKIKKIEVDGGPIYKRMRPISRGRSHAIKKRTSHITVILEGEK